MRVPFSSSRPGLAIKPLLGMPVSSAAGSSGDKALTEADATSLGALGKGSKPRTRGVITGSKPQASVSDFNQS
jgi:hypothetical protein